MNINKNAIQLLISVMKHRNWHQGKLERRLAGEYKRNAAKGKLSYEKAVDVLQLIGYYKVKEEVWAKGPDKKPPQEFQIIKEAAIKNAHSMQA